MFQTAFGCALYNIGSKISKTRHEFCEISENLEEVNLRRRENTLLSFGDVVDDSDLDRFFWTSGQKHFLVHHSQWQLLRSSQLVITKAKQ
jgi:hypothetical protein